MSTVAVRAELFALRRHPALFIVSGIWFVQILGFSYLLVYLMRGGLSSTDSEALLGALLPAGLDRYILGGLPAFGGPMALILGVILSTSDYRWDTLRTLLVRRPSRISFLGGKFFTVFVAGFALSAATLLASLVGSMGVAVASGRSFALPGPGPVLLVFAAIWLVLTAWAATGFAVGILVRNTGAGIGVGLLVTVVLDQLSAPAASLPLVDALRTGLLGANSGSLAVAFGVREAPGVVETTSGPVAALVLAAYVAGSFAVAAVVFRRRDVG
ncbi:ABC transporter permease [Amycolatopsis magusensis]|uniref:ABC transporter permease n=1 Tax=Amycolatopsis magusensis TaxID=882444 RepID=UPI003C2AF2F0